MKIGKNDKKENKIKNNSINMAKNIKKENVKNKKQQSNNEISNVIKINSDFSSQNFIYSKKLRNIFITIVIIVVLLIVRIGFLQFVQGSYLKELAYNQQAINQIISPKRGNIYDSKGKILATSAQVDTITINPKSIVGKTDESTKALKEKVAQGLSEIFELDYNETLEKVNSTSQVETIARKVEKDKVDKLTSWMDENDISVGINIDEDTKRYYPGNNLLSHVLGFCGSDNEGRYGIEYEWNSILAGTPGKIVSSKDVNQQEIPNTEESYIAPENGSDLTLTIDVNIQKIVEKYLKQACIDNECSKGGVCIVMDPKTGDILSMANYPDFDLNNPDTPNETLALTFDTLSTEEQNNALFSMWKNKAISDIYEPGSVFKLITASVALEEDITEPDIERDFNCTGHETFQDSSRSKPLTINCWKYYAPHGYQTLTEALGNSCNPAFMQLAKRITAPTLYKYYEAFGLFDKTGIDLPGESNSVILDLDKVGEVELATASFGQRTINITPLQMITAVSAIANDGVLMKPRIVKQITNSETGAVTNIDPVEVRQVLSSDTAETMREMMESVVVDGTGGKAAVSGYSVGGKTGTSEPIEGSEEDGYVSSYVAISPVEDTQVAILVVLFDPQNEKAGHNGGQIVAPVVSQMLTEILPTLGVPSDAEQSTTDDSDLITVLDVRNKTITEAEKILNNLGLKTIVNTSNDKNSTIVVDQVPKPGVSLSKDSVVVLYDADNSVRTSVTVPDLTGKTAQQATSILKNLNLNISITGSGTVSSQNPAKDTKVEEGTVINVTLSSPNRDTH